MSLLAGLGMFVVMSLFILLVLVDDEKKEK
jgi:hypothetical protein